jgi:hypothetical protein
MVQYGLLSRLTDLCIEPIALAVLEVAPRLQFFLSLAGIVFLASFVGLLVLFLIHQASLWLSQDPEKAFHAARTAVDVGSQIWDSAAVLYNAANDVAIQVIPLWNAQAMYLVQPIVFTSLEVLSIAFAGRPYSGVLTEEDFPFEGHRCDVDGSTGPAAQWCGGVAAYSAKLGYSTGASAFVANGSLVLSAETGRRLSAEFGRPLIPIIDVSGITDAVQAIVSALVVVGGTVSDLFFHVTFEILSLILKPMISLVMQLVESLGAAVFVGFKGDRRRMTADTETSTFADILQYGIDLLLVLVTEVAIPLVFAMLDAFFCVLDLFRPLGWGEQLDCIAQSCWQAGSDVMADTFHLFSSVPIISERVENVFTKTVNAVTGKRFSSKASGDADLPDLGDSGEGTPQAETCAACFTCRVPELRAIWLVSALIGGWCAAALRAL